jgi:Na+-translocating ferredoxin:NAD+ oxidoreductase subunit C
VPVKDVIEQCGGYSADARKVIIGGPLTGIAQHTDELSVTKGTTGIIVLNSKEAKTPEASNCIRCGKCIEICPFIFSRCILLTMQ